MKNWLETLALRMHRIGAYLVFAIMLVAVLEVVARQIFNRPFAGTSEIVANAIMILTFLQVPYVILHEKLLRVTFLTDRLGARWRGGLDLLAYGLGATIFIAMAVTGWGPAWRSLSSGEFFGNSSFRIPAWPLRLSALVLWSMAALACVKLAVTAAVGRRLCVSDEGAKEEANG